MPLKANIVKRERERERERDEREREREREREKKGRESIILLTFQLNASQIAQKQHRSTLAQVSSQRFLPFSLTVN